MPRHAKHTKIDRDREMVAGLRKYGPMLINMRFGPGLTSAAAVAAVYQEHLDAMADATAKEIAWRVAVDRERALEAKLKVLHGRVQSYLHGSFGANNVGELKRFGLKARKTPYMSTETKRRAVEKRLETRKLRRTMGRKQRQRIKGSG